MPVDDQGAVERSAWVASHRRSGPERKKETLDRFFAEKLPSRRRRAVRAVCVDMWKPYLLSLQDWGKVLGDVPATTAILDRFLAHAEIIKMQGKSYRLHGRARRASRAQETKA